nr:NUDIX domain-containing protein [Lactovum miscens]
MKREVKVDYISWIRSKVGHDKIILNFVVALIRNKQGKILMQKRVDSGLWGFPGGCIEIGESFEKALRREVFEETQIQDFEIVTQLGAYNWLNLTYPNGDIAQPIDIWYVCNFNGEVDLTYKDEETSELRWVNFSKLDVELFNKNFAIAIEDYLKWESTHMKVGE